MEPGLKPRQVGSKVHDFKTLQSNPLFTSPPFIYSENSGSWNCAVHNLCYCTWQPPDQQYIKSSINGSHTTHIVIALLVVHVYIIRNPGSRVFRERGGCHSQIMHPVALWLYAGGDEHHQPWEPIGKGTEVQHLDVAWAEVIHHLQVPDHKEEHHGFYQHPEEAGEEKVVQKARDDGAAHLERRSTRTQDPHLPASKEQVQRKRAEEGLLWLAFPQTLPMHSFDKYL